MKILLYKIIQNRIISGISVLLGFHLVKKIRRKLFVPNTVIVRDTTIKFSKIGRVGMESDLYYLGMKALPDTYSIELLAYILAISTKDRPLLIDVGADIGKETICSLMKVEKAWSICFEPLKASYEILNRNIRLNQLSDRVISYNYGLSDNRARFRLEDHSESSPSFSVSQLAKKMDHIEEGDFIELIIGDELLESKYTSNILKNIEILKIDVETHEPNVLKGLKKIVGEYRPLLLIEVLNEDVGRRIENELPFGYNFYQILEEKKGVKKVNSLYRISPRDLNYLLVPEEKNSLLVQLNIL